MMAPSPDPYERRTPARQLVVLSGKGGTGKTTIVAALAALAGDKVLADCDVDAPDLHLVLDPQVTHSEVFIAGKQARIALQRCNACGDCAEHCRFDAIHLQTETGHSVYMVDPTACEGCGLCTRVCASMAVELIDAERGRLFVSDTRCGPMVHAQLDIGAENSGKLVTLVRSRASQVADAKGTVLVIVDGPPGIGCPVIASASGADLVLVVTEPTLSGVHDLKRAAELVQGFRVPLAVCINKADLNEQMCAQVRDFCASHGYPVVGELAFDPQVVQAQIEARSIVESGDSVVTGQIVNMWKSLENMLTKEKERV
jgi:MinD superfamily P-loop ATPase